MSTFDPSEWNQRKPDRDDFNDAASWQAAFEKWDRERKEAENKAKFDDAVENINQTVNQARRKSRTKEPTPQQDQNVENNQTAAPTESPAPEPEVEVKKTRTKKQERKAQVESQQSSPKVSENEIVDVQPIKQARKESLKPIKTKLDAIAKNATKSARNSSVVRTQITGPIHERLVGLSSMTRHINTRINQTESNLQERINRNTGLLRGISSENNHILDRLKSLRNISFISKGLNKLRRRVDGVNERTKVINKNIKILQEPVEVSPPQQPGLLETLWTGIGTKLGIVKTQNAALMPVPRNKLQANKRGVVGEGKPRKSNKQYQSRPSQISLEAKKIYDRYTSPWTTGTQARILANLVAPGITTIPALARVAMGTKRGRSLFKSKKKELQELNKPENTEKKQDEKENKALDILGATSTKIKSKDKEEAVEQKQDEKESREDLLKELANLLRPSREDSKKPLEKEGDKKGILESLGDLLLSGKGIEMLKTGVLSILGASGFASAAVSVLAGVAVAAVFYNLGKEAESWADKNIPGYKKLREDVTEDLERYRDKSKQDEEARNAYRAGYNGEKNPGPHINPLVDDMYEQGQQDRKNKEENDKLPWWKRNMVDPKAIEDEALRLARSRNISMLNIKRYNLPETGTREGEFNGIIPPLLPNVPYVSPILDPGMMQDIKKETSKYMEDAANITYNAPVTITTTNNQVNTNNASNTLLAPRTMFDNYQLYNSGNIPGWAR